MPQLNSISNFEKFMFYIAIGAGEECLFRIVPIFAILFLGMLIYKNPIVWKITGVAVGGITFGLSHYWDPIKFFFNGILAPGVYFHDIGMVWATTAVGIFLGIMMLVANNDPSVPIVSHMLYNAITSLNLLV